MKLRIKGNSIRFRLSRSEVQQLSSGVALEESTSFGTRKLVYSVRPSESKGLSATYDHDAITLYISREYLSDWHLNDVVGFDETVMLDQQQSLKLLIEKDFKCLDVSEEDQSEFFDNPGKTC